MVRATPEYIASLLSFETFFRPFLPLSRLTPGFIRFYLYRRAVSPLHFNYRKRRSLVSQLLTIPMTMKRTFLFLFTERAIPRHVPPFVFTHTPRRNLQLFSMHCSFAAGQFNISRDKFIARMHLLISRSPYRERGHPRQNFRYFISAGDSRRHKFRTAAPVTASSTL